GEPPAWVTSPILKEIRDYNEDDCRSNAELTEWLRNLAREQGIAFAARRADGDSEEPKSADPKIANRQELAAKLRTQGHAVSVVLLSIWITASLWQRSARKRSRINVMVSFPSVDRF